MDKPKIDTGLVYGTVARLLPQEGRDFTIDAVYGQDGKPRVVITPHTPIGTAWVPFLEKDLATPLQKNGVSVGQGGSAAAEVATINSIREQVEREAAAARNARLREAEKDRDAKFEAAKKAHDARVAKSGENSQLSDEEKTANRAANEANNVFFRLSRMAQKIDDVRSSVNAAAVTAANEDEKKGKSWAVDMAAPLTSLFDRQDVTDKLKMKERLIAELAAKMVDEDGLRMQAVNVAKQYIIQKEAKNG